MSVNAPFAYVRSSPSLPNLVPPNDDSAAYSFMVRAPDQPGASLVLNITINALTAPPP